PGAAGGSRPGLEAAAEQLGPLAHALQAIAFAGSVRPRRRRRTEVVHRELCAARRVPEVDLDSVRRCMFSNVGQGLLGGSVERQLCGGLELDWLAVHGVIAWKPGVALEVLDEAHEHPGSRHPVAAQGADRAPCLVESLL